MLLIITNSKQQFQTSISVLSRPDAEKTLVQLDVLRGKVSYDKMYPFKLLSSFWRIDYGNDELVDLILSTPIEDINILTEMAMYAPEEATLEKQIKLFDDSTGCYSKAKTGRGIFTQIRYMI